MGQKMFSSELWNNPGSTQVLTQKAIFGFGFTSSGYNSVTGITNLVSDSGVVASDTTGVGTGRRTLAASGYGEDKAIFGFGRIADASYTGITNLVSNSGVVASDTAAVGTAKLKLAAAAYGGDKAIFAFGHDGSSWHSTSNLVSNEGVVASDTSGVGSTRYFLGASGYGEDKAIFGFGMLAPGNANTAITNLVSNTGVVASDTAGVGSVRAAYPAGAVYGGDKGIFGFGRTGTSGVDTVTAITSLVSNSGVVASDTSGVGTARASLAAAGYAN